MSLFAVGSYVTHSKLMDLGPGRIAARENGNVHIAFASGDRSFSEAIVAPYLVTTMEAPILPPVRKTATRAKRAKAAPKVAAK